MDKSADIIAPLVPGKAPADTRVVVAMSGGVDSSVTAALLHEQGYDVIGLTMQLYDHGQALAKKGACCAGQDIYDARRVAENCGFPHYVLDYENNFKDSVIDEFVQSYLRGETPIPCVRCNQTVKFQDMLDTARDLGADCLATGHYIQRVVNPDNRQAELHRAIDPTKDQSYFLFATTQEQLDFVRFPLGGWIKDRTRMEAERLGLLNAEKPDSQDICFVPNGDYASVVKKHAPAAQNPGDIVHIDGRVVGQHEGIVGYTIGQRKGLGIGGGVTENNDPLYVVRLDAAANQVIVGPKEALARDTIHIRDCNWLPGSGEPVSGPVLLKFRSVMQPIAAQLDIGGDGTAILSLDTPQYGIAPGQAAVCYDGARVLGGGWISHTDNKILKSAA
ncbi:MAG: tRNA 2-thiouridine(34) synthase MnmA [Rhodospirillales bacterium]|nr:tRNA 2-thiouridine(34) synthase MnmA [Rhodospirillales bacterium]